MTSRKVKLENRIEWTDREKGGLHRLDGPAKEFNDGSKEWWVAGKLHRADGPAIEWISGFKHWCYNGIEFFSKEEWFKALTKEEQIAYLFKLGEK